jgi:uncharacterized membrane protein
VLFFGLLVALAALASIFVAGWMLAVHFVAVFPANVHNALNGLSVEGLPGHPLYYWLRLPFQPLAVWWALFAAECIRWPRRGAGDPRPRASSAVDPVPGPSGRR